VIAVEGGPWGDGLAGKLDVSGDCKGQEVAFASAWHMQLQEAQTTVASGIQVGSYGEGSMDIPWSASRPAKLVEREVDQRTGKPRIVPGS
jgi:hypothetical protein